MSELAVLAPQVEASIAPETADAAALRPAVETALRSAVGALHASAERYQGSADETAEALRGFADQLEQPQAWLAIDRVVHALVGDVLAAAIARPHDAPSPLETARAVALGILARDAVLWPGAGPRMGCTYGYDGVLATARLTALAAAEGA